MRRSSPAPEASSQSAGRELHGFLRTCFAAREPPRSTPLRCCAPLMACTCFIAHQSTRRPSPVSPVALVCAHVVRRVVGLVQPTRLRCVGRPKASSGGFLDCSNQLHVALVHRTLNRFVLLQMADRVWMVRLEVPASVPEYPAKNMFELRRRRRFTTPSVTPRSRSIHYEDVSAASKAPAARSTSSSNLWCATFLLLPMRSRFSINPNDRRAHLPGSHRRTSIEGSCVNEPP